jgi:hypothetical protein
MRQASVSATLNAGQTKSLFYRGISVFTGIEALISNRRTKMKNIRGFALGLALGLAAAISTVGLAQETKPADQNKKAESCCAMESCCKGDSCSMKDHAKKDHSKDHSKHDGCCCDGESCNMKMKNKQDTEKLG